LFYSPLLLSVSIKSQNPIAFLLRFSTFNFVPFDLFVIIELFLSCWNIGFAPSYPFFAYRKPKNPYPAWLTRPGNSSKVEAGSGIAGEPTTDFNRQGIA
jgi:hypothetical protein